MRLPSRSFLANKKASRAAAVLFGLIAAQLVAAVLISGLVAPTATAESGPQPVLLGSQWLGGQGVDVYYQDEAHSNGPWQCVELAQRLYEARGWYATSQFAGVGVASDIYTQAVAQQLFAPGGGVFTYYDNSSPDSSYWPVPGDMIVTKGSSDNLAGHVVVVDKVDTVSGLIWIAEQNHWDDPMTSTTPLYYRDSAGAIHRLKSAANTLASNFSADVILGTVHSPANLNSVGPIPKPQGLPGRLPWAAGTSHSLYATYDRGWSPSSVDGFGFDVGGAQETISAGAAVYPLFGGTLVYAGCAQGDWKSLGQVVAIQTVVDGQKYTAIFSHLASINISALLGNPNAVGPNTQLGTFGNTTTAADGTCNSGSGPLRLHVGLFEGGTLGQGMIEGGTPVYPEPLIGASAYEKFDWWSGPMTATDLTTGTGTPGGVWQGSSVANGSKVANGVSVPLSASWADTNGNVPVEVRFTAYYRNWSPGGSQFRDFDPTSTWRVLADCKYADRNNSSGPCQWDVANQIVSYPWDPTSSGASPVPWLPDVNAAASTSSCVPVILSFDVYDSAGYRNLAPNGTISTDINCPAGLQPKAASSGASPAQAGTVQPADSGDNAQRAIYLLPFDPATGCDTSWAAGVNGAWSNALLWTNGVPNATKRACITAGGSYTVFLSGSATARRLVLGGSGSSPTLSLSGSSLTVSGNLTNASGATVALSSSSTLTLSAGTFTNNGLLQTTVSGTYVPSLSADLDNEGSLDLQAGLYLSKNGGVITNNGSVSVSSTWILTVSNSTWHQLSGSLSLAGKLHFNAGGFDYQGGTISGASPIELANGSLGITAGAPSTHEYDFVGVWGTTMALVSNIPAGNTVVVEPSLWSSYYSSCLGTLALPAGGFTNAGTLRFAQNTSGYSCNLPVSGGVNFVNTGTLALTAAPYATTTLSLASGNLSNTGTISLSGQSGSLTLSSGNLTNASGATVALSSSSTLTLSAGTFTNNGLLQTTVSGTYVPSLSADLDNEGSLDLQAGLYLSKNGGVITNNGSVSVSSTWILTMASAPTNYSGSTFSGGSWHLAGVLKFPGSGISANASSLILDGSGSGILNGSTDALTAITSNSGSLELRGGKSLTTSKPISNSGTVIIGAGSTLTATGAYAQTAGSTTLLGSTSKLAATGAQVNIGGGSLSGIGTVSPALVNSGTVQPGSPIGLLSVTGPYTQTSTGHLQVEVTGTAPSAFDRLTATGALNLDGTLDIVTADPTLVSGDSFAFLSGSTVSGTFASVTGSKPVPDLLYTLVYGSTGVILTTAVDASAPTVWVETAANGSGTVVPSQSISSGSSLTVYAVSRDASGNFVANISVTWSMASTTGGVATSDLSTTSGTSTVFTGHLVGTGTIHAVSGSFTADSGVITTVTGTATQIAINAGNGQSAAVGTAVSIAPSVIVKDAYGNPVSGVSVTFAVATGGGSLTGGSATTNASGIAAVGSWTLGTTPGSDTLTATSTGLTGSPLTFTATATTGTATKYLVSSSSYSPIAGGAVTISAQLADTYGNPVSSSGLVVTWSKSGSGGSFATGTSTTNAAGLASVSFTTGTTAGTAYTVTGTDTSSRTGTSSAITTLAGALSRLFLTPSTATVNPGVGQLYAAEGFDVYGNDLGDFTSATTFTIAGGTCAGTSCTSTVAGDHTVTGTDGTATGTAKLTIAGVQGVVSGTTYHAITPTRALDTRNGTGGLSGPFTNHVARTFTVSGVPTNATAVTGNLTVTGQSSSGYLYIGPVAANNPTSSTLNFPVGDDRANAVTVQLGTGGTLAITFVASSNGPTAQAIFDVTGYFTPDTSGATYHAITPTRALDTRSGTGGLSGPFTNHAARTFTVAGIPSGATAVTGNLTVTGQTSSGYLYIGPTATNSPTSSTLNFPVGDDRANAVTVQLGAGGTLSITFVASSNGPTAQAIFDVTGYFTADMTGAVYVPLSPSRVLDTRNGTGGLSGPFTNHAARTFTVSGVPSNATAVTGNLTVTGQTSSGYLFIGPLATDNPGSSTLNFPVGDDRANAVAVQLGAGGTLSITFVAPSSGPSAQAIFDLTGYFAPAGG